MIVSVSPPPKRHQKANLSNSQLSERPDKNARTQRFGECVSTHHGVSYSHLCERQTKDVYFTSCLSYNLSAGFSRHRNGTASPALGLRNFCKLARTHQPERLHRDLVFSSHSGPLVAAPPPHPRLPSGCVKFLDAPCCQVCIFLVFPIFKQQQPLLQQPEGMCANSGSPVGRIAITEPLLYPSNCKGSCFPSDQAASLPPGRRAPSPLAAAAK